MSNKVTIIRKLDLPIPDPIPQEYIHDGWDSLEETTPSGKALFRCKTCKRISPTPDKHCFTLAEAMSLKYEVKHDRP